MPNKHGAHNLHNCAAARQARRSTWTRRGGGVSVTFAHYYRLHRPDFTHSHGPTKPQNRQCVRAAHTLCHPGAHMTPPRNPPGATTTHKCRGVDASLRSIARPLSNPLAGGAAASVPFPKTKSCGNFCPLSSPRGLVSSRASPPLLGLTEAKGWGGGDSIVLDQPRRRRHIPRVPRWSLPRRHAPHSVPRQSRAAAAASGWLAEPGAELVSCRGPGVAEHSGVGVAGVAAGPLAGGAVQRAGD